MAIDERSRHSLFQRLEGVLGPIEAETLMSYLPPVGWADVATKQDLISLENRLENRLMTAFHQEMQRNMYSMMGFFVALAGLFLTAVKFL